MAVNKIALCNQALAEVPHGHIDDFEEQATAAEWCARLYPSTLAYCLDRHDWKFARARKVLAQTTNDREGEWAYAYAVPEECIQELRVLPPTEADWYSVPLLAGQLLAPWPSLALLAPLMARYYVSAGKIYSNTANALLEFIAAAPNEQTFRPLFERAFVLELASRLVMPLKGDGGRQRQGDLVKAAEVAMDRAMADDINRDDELSSYGIFMNETELARGGANVGLIGWPLR